MYNVPGIPRFSIALSAAIALLQGGCANKDSLPISSNLEYIRQDGGQIIRIDLNLRSYHFADPREVGSDLGGSVKNCSDNKINCVDLSGFVLSVPRGQPLPNNWTSSGKKFKIVGRVNRSDSPLWLVEVSEEGDAYMYFSYSFVRGIESISLQREGVGRDMAKTYFLSGDHGLLFSPRSGDPKLN